VRVNVAVCCKLPDVPVTVTVALPPMADAVAVRLSVLVPDPFGTGFVLNVPVTPDGNPLTDRVTGDENPVDVEIVMVLVAAPPAVIAVEDDADMEKSAAIVNVTAFVCMIWLFPEPQVAVN